MKRTMKDLAEELGISRTTVSLVLRGKADQYRISGETQKKILDLVEKENFKPNYFAQGLNRGRTKTIGVIFPDVFEEFMVEMIRGIGEVLDQADYTMILMTSRFSPAREKKNMDELLHRGIDGMLLVPSSSFRGEKEERSHINKIQADRYPLVQIDRITDDWTGSSVCQDDREGGTLAARYLKEKECTVSILVSLDLTASSIRNRIEGFETVSPEPHRILLKEQNRQSSDLKQALDKIIKNLPAGAKPGFFVTTAGLAIRVRDILSEREFVLNRDYFLIRFGEDPQGYNSGMASIHQPHYEMGKQGALLLLNHIKENQISTLNLPVSLSSR